MVTSNAATAMGPRALGALAIAGVAAAPVFLTAPALAGTAGNADARAGARVVTSCGAGVSAVNVRLPAGFDPLTATPAQLAANDLPLRPTGRVQLAAWRRFVTGGVRAARSTCVFAAVTPSSAPRSIVGDAKSGESAQSIVGDAKSGESASRSWGTPSPASRPSRSWGTRSPASRPSRSWATPAPAARHPDAAGHRAAAQPGRQPGHRRHPRLWSTAPGGSPGRRMTRPPPCRRGPASGSGGPGIRSSRRARPRAAISVPTCGGGWPRSGRTSSGSAWTPRRATRSTCASSCCAARPR